ncbi:MAG: PAS domain S-box protein [Gemmatimonadaceae bacterium]|nr:PAS domain S-box protein [Gemmatimonadaceae bacterium]
MPNQLIDYIASGETTGDEYLHGLLRETVRVAGADAGFVGEFSGEYDRVQVKVLAGDGAFGGLSTYSLEGTPCRGVVEGVACVYPSNVAQQFPEDVGLERLGVQGYIGVPLRSHDGRVAGLLVLLSRSPIADPDMVLRFARLAGQRAAIELDRIKDRRSLREERDFSSALLQTSVAAIVAIEPSGEIVFANAQAERILGLTRSDIVGRRYDAPSWHSTALDGGPWPDENQPFVRVLTTGEPVYDVRHAIEWKDGRRVCLSINGAPITDAEGRVTTLVFSITDITAELARAAELAAHDERLRILSEAASDYVFWFDREPDGSRTPMQAAGAFERIMGCTPREYEARGGAAKIVHPDDLADHQSFVADIFAGGTREHSFRFRRADGQERWLHIVARGVHDRHVPGRMRVVGAAQDVTERRKLEEKLAHSQRLEATGRLAGGVAHDFNNLLVAILGEAEIARASLPEHDPVHRALRAIEDTAARATAVTRQLLALARNQPVAPRVIDALATVRGLHALAHRLLGEQITVAFELEQEPVPIRIDPSQFEQILINLFVNARDAMSTGGRLVVRGTRDAAGLLLTVRDSGSGIDPTVLARIFDPFFTTKEHGRGTGLGLSICAEIAVAYDGAITAANAPDGGAVFTIRFPFASAAIEAPRTAPALTPAASANEHVLVVEDADDIRALILRVLQRAGYRVSGARSVAEAKAMVHDPSIALLLTDFTLPDGNGAEVVGALRSRGGTMPRVIISSGYVEADVERQSVLAQADALLAKPYLPSALTELVREVLDRPC